MAELFGYAYIYLLTLVYFFFPPCTADCFSISIFLLVLRWDQAASLDAYTSNVPLY
jgi:hypothetical protein